MSKHAALSSCCLDGLPVNRPPLSAFLSPSSLHFLSLLLSAALLFLKDPRSLQLSLVVFWCLTCCHSSDRYEELNNITVFFSLVFLFAMSCSDTHADISPFSSITCVHCSAKPSVFPSRPLLFFSASVWVCADTVAVWPAPVYTAGKLKLSKLTTHTHTHTFIHTTHTYTFIHITHSRSLQPGSIQTKPQSLALIFSLTQSQTVAHKRKNLCWTQS